MPAKKVNYEELKPYIPQNDNEENYALLTHYLLMDEGEAKSQKHEELVNRIEGKPDSLPPDVKEALNKDEIYNAFILPGRTEGDHFLRYFGYSTADYKNETEKSYSKIYGFILDMKSIMYRHIPKDKELIEELANIIPHYNDNKKH